MQPGGQLVAEFTFSATKAAQAASEAGETLPPVPAGLDGARFRLVAGPGSRTYGVPSVKAAWFAAATRAGSVPPAVFWPAPNVDSGLVRLDRREPPATTASRAEVFAAIAEELGGLMSVDHVRMWRYEEDDSAVTVASAGVFDEPAPVA